MKFKVGDRVKNQSGDIGIIEKVNPFGGGVRQEHYKILYEIENKDDGYYYATGLELAEQLITDSLCN